MQLNDYIAKLDELFLPTLQNLNIPHPRLMIWFSGPPSSGKSQVAQAVEAKFQAVRLENDALRILLVKHFPDLSFDERNELTYAYRDHVMQWLIDTAANGLWVLDSSIDRSYETFYAFAKQHAFAHFLIAMDIPEAIHREWIIAGGDRPYSTAHDYLLRMSQRRQEQQHFLAGHQPDIVLRPDYDIEQVLDTIEAKLARL